MGMRIEKLELEFELELEWPSNVFEWESTWR